MSRTAMHPTPPCPRPDPVATTIAADRHRPGTASPASGGTGCPRGLTVVELVVALALIGILLAVAIPPLGRLRAEAAVRSGGAAVTAAVAGARSLAVGFARPADFVLDTASWSYSVVLDTTLAGLGPDTVLTRGLPELRDVLASMSSDPAVLCFDARGVGRSGAGCPTGLTLVLTAGGWVDTLAFSATGRLIP